MRFRLVSFLLLASLPLFGNGDGLVQSRTLVENKAPLLGEEIQPEEEQEVEEDSLEKEKPSKKGSNIKAVILGIGVTATAAALTWGIYSSLRNKKAPGHGGVNGELREVRWSSIQDYNVGVNRNVGEAESLTIDIEDFFSSPDTLTQMLPTIPAGLKKLTVRYYQGGQDIDRGQADVLLKRPVAQIIQRMRTLQQLEDVEWTGFRHLARKQSEARDEDLMFNVKGFFEALDQLPRLKSLKYHNFMTTESWEQIMPMEHFLYEEGMFRGEPYDSIPRKDGLLCKIFSKPQFEEVSLQDSDAEIYEPMPKGHDGGAWMGDFWTISKLMHRGLSSFEKDIPGRKWVKRRPAAPAGAN